MNYKRKLPWYYWIPVFGAIPFFFLEEKDDCVYDSGFFEYQMVWLSCGAMITLAFLVTVLFHLTNYITWKR
jgi:hypothetical protein